MLCELEVDTLDGRGTLNGPRENRRQGLFALEVRIELGEGLGLHKAILVEKPHYVWTLKNLNMSCVAAGAMLATHPFAH